MAPLPTGAQEGKKGLELGPPSTKTLPGFKLLNNTVIEMHPKKIDNTSGM